jgi:hypothetical protein
MRARRLVAVLAAEVEGYSRLIGADEVGTFAHCVTKRLSDRVEKRESKTKAR